MNYQEKLLKIFGNNYEYIISKHSDVINRLKEDNYIEEFITLYTSYNKSLDFLNSFYAAVRVIFYNHYSYEEKVINHRVTRIIPEDFKSMNFLVKRLPHCDNLLFLFRYSE